MSDDGPPFVTRPDDVVPLVIPVAPSSPRPGLFEASWLTVAYAVVLFGTLLLIAFTGVAVLALGPDRDALNAPEGAKPGSVSSLPPSLALVLAWSVPAGYFAGFLFTLVVFRVVVKGNWVREIGLGRLPLAHLGLGMLALPAFVVLSDGLARVLFTLFGRQDLLDQTGHLGELYHGFHPAFVVLAVGIAPGVAEELWCRGFLGRGFIGRYGWAAGVALSSLYFGLLHIYPPPYVLVTAAMGACLHFAYICSRSLWVPMAIHAVNNGFAGLAAVGVAPTGGIDRALEAAPVLVFALAAVVLLSCGWAAWTGRATADGPRGVMVPPGGVSTRRTHPAAVGLALASAGVLVGLFATS